MLPIVLAFAVSADGDRFGRVVLAMGSVTANGRALKAGDSVFRGERVATDAEGRAKFLLEDRSVLSLGPQSEMELQAVRSPEVPKTTVKLLLGRIWANVQKTLGGESKFDVVTANAVAGVRGTSFFGEVRGGRSTFTVANGTVAVTQGQQQQVLNALQQISAEGGLLSAITPVQMTQLQTLIQQMSTSGQLSGDAQQRLNTLQASQQPTGTPNDLQTGGQLNQLPPVNIDPQQTSQSTLIRGRIEVVNP